MADAVMTKGQNLSVLVPQVWSARYYDVLLAELPFNSLISRDYEGEISALGDTVKISTFPEFDDAIELAEDARADASAVTVAQQSLVINKRIVKDFIVTNTALLQSLPAVDKLRDLAIYSIQKKIQALLIAAIVPSALPDHSIAYTAGTTLDLAKILEAKELLDKQDVPLSDRHMVMGAAQLNDLFNITGLVSTEFGVSGAPLQSGQLPAQILGFQPHFTTAVGNVVYTFHASFMTMASQQGLNVREYDLGVDGKRQSRVNIDTLLGIKQLDAKRVVTIG